MLPPKPQTQSTENLLLKCQKETHKKCLPPEWSIHPPNKEILPPPDTLALAIQIDASSSSSSLTRINFLDAASNRSVGSILGAEYRGSIVVVPWRPGLKFVCVATGRRRSGCRIGVVREAKRGAAAAVARMKKKDAVVATAAVAAAAKRNASRGRNISSNKTLAVDDSHRASIGSSASSSGSPTRSRIPTLKGQRMSIKKYENNRHVSVNAARAIGNKSRIPRRRVVEQCC
ncbi:hypothetical protein TGAMA5MH_07969 [Trichoderma gamsii]|uniref:Uncharacterized protein n=1 Tax=Trichoderma gamsii TaxID=398673 RepID=A0A2K0T3E3_9HYPO|nr:hypothetical protein TGAMA5MH_07969 [Trichoderma gamsii]